MRSAKRKQWWAHARKVLFDGIALDAQRSRTVDALIEDQLWSRDREERIALELRHAGVDADPEHLAALRAEQKQIQEDRESRQDLYEEMRALLDEAQRPAFDMNRARLVAEHQDTDAAPPVEGLSAPRSPSS